MSEYRYLGRSALKVSPLCLGTMMFGAQTPDDVAARIVDSARAHGVNFIDTADVYNGGASEEVVGRLIKADRDDWVLATKFANAPREGANIGGYSRKWIFQTVDDSLRRLGTDYIDLLYIHKPVLGAPIEEPLRALGDLIAQGKIRYYGVSNFRGWRIAEIAQTADRLGMDRPVASQPLYNIVNRTAEVEQMPAASAYGLGNVPYSPLARGILTGKYSAGSAPAEDSRAGRGDKRMHEVEFRDESMIAAKAITDRAQAKGMSAADFAIAWALANPLVSSLIGGPRTEEQWEGYLRALAVTLDADDEAFVDGLVAPGHPSTPGFTDPAYPVEGRPARG